MVVALVGRMLSDEPAAPSPEPEGSDIVEVYSFSTGEFRVKTDAILNGRKWLDFGCL